MFLQGHYFNCRDVGVYLLAQMDFSSAEKLADTAGALLFLTTLIVVAFIGFIFIGGWWFFNRHGSRSPYGGGPLVRGSFISYSAVESVHEYIAALNPKENPIYSLEKAAICRLTGRVFPNAITKWDRISVNWSFLNKRHRGNWVSWGSLSPAERKRVRESHKTLSGYQVEESSSRPSPRDVEREYMMLKPGPLYVDIDSKVVMGWKIVPGTDLEVLVIQLPNKEN